MIIIIRNAIYIRSPIIRLRMSKKRLIKLCVQFKLA